MSHALHADYTFDADAFATAQGYHTRATGRQMRWLRWGFLGATLATVSYILVTNRELHPLMLVAVALGYLGVIGAEVLNHPRTQARTIRRRFARGAYQPQRVAYVIREDGLTTTTDGAHAQHIPWGGFQRVVETPDGFLLYRDRAVFLWLPADALRPAGEATVMLRAIWARHALPVTRVG